MALLRTRSRSLWLRLHRWLGLGLGAVFVMLGLTGSLLVFYVGIDEAIEPALQMAGPTPTVQRWHDVLLALQQAHPQRDRGWRIELPPDGRGLVTARYLKPAETAGDSGRTVVGLLGLLMTLSLLGGGVLWWPRSGHWRAALRVKLTGSRQRRHYDLHKLAGVGGGVVLLVLAVTGAALALPDGVEPPLARISPPLAMPTPQATLQPRLPLITLDQALERARAHWPEGVPRWVDTPPAGGAIYRVRLWLPGGPSERFPRSYLWIHAQTGQVLASRDARRQSAGDAVLAWLHPLHNGEAFGLAGRVLACVAGLLPLLLMVTGVLRWVDRRRAGLARTLHQQRSTGAMA